MILLSPAISVIIPLYNAEKYIAQCLQSILHQTFQDYEVIVVDDCSTDGSIAQVEKIMPQFNGRLKLVKRNKNSGGGSIPRNIGMNLSIGKYISFIDSDDMFTRSALEEFYKIAESTQADVLHAEKWLIPTNGDVFDAETKFTLSNLGSETEPFVDKVTFESEDLTQRIIRYRQNKFSGFVWNKFFRREFLVENMIEFPKIKIAREDAIFCFYCVILAKNYVRIPNVVNIYRVRNDSISHEKLSPDKHLRKYWNDIIANFKLMDDFMSKIDFFVQHPEYKYLPLDLFMQQDLNFTATLYEKIPPYQLDSILREELNENSQNNTALTSYMFSALNMFRLKLINAQKQIKQLNEEINSLKN